MHVGRVSSASRYQHRWLEVDFVSIFGESRILRAMKNRFRLLALIILFTFVFLGCSENVQTSSSDAEVILGADPAATIIEIFGEPDRLARTERLIAALRAVPADQTQVFEEALAGLDFPNRELDRVLVVTAWAEHDAPAATRWAKNIERVDVVRDAMFSEAVYRWALEDPESFVSDMEMSLYILPGIDKSIMRALIKGWFESGQPRLETYIHDMTPQSIDRQRAIDTLANVMAKRDSPDKIIEWATALSGDTVYKTSVYARVAAELVVIDPERVVEWCNEVCDTPIGKRMPHLIAASWADVSGEGAMDFILSRPNATAVRTGARAAYRRFIRDEPERAFAWLETTTEEQRYGPVMQGPVSMYVNRRSTRGQPEIAIEWLKYLEDEGQRDSVRITIMRRWLRTDNNAAEAWMAQSSMSKEDKLEAHKKFDPKAPRLRTN